MVETVRKIQFVLAGADPGDEATLRTLLEGTPWALVSAAGYADAARALHQVSLPIVLADCNLEGRPWQETLRALLRSRRRACVILLGGAGAPDSQQVVRRGGFDVLSRPFDKDQVLATLLCAYSTARMHWLSFGRVHASPVSAALS